MTAAGGASIGKNGASPSSGMYVMVYRPGVPGAAANDDVFNCLPLKKQHIAGSGAGVRPCLRPLATSSTVTGTPMPTPPFTAPGAARVVMLSNHGWSRTTSTSPGDTTCSTVGCDAADCRDPSGYRT